MNKPSNLDGVLATLKEHLRDEHDFAKIATFFHDKIVPLLSFAGVGKPQKNQLLKQMLMTLFEQRSPRIP